MHWRTTPDFAVWLWRSFSKVRRLYLQSNRETTKLSGEEKTSSMDLCRDSQDHLPLANRLIVEDVWQIFSVYARLYKKISKMFFSKNIPLFNFTSHYDISPLYRISNIFITYIIIIYTLHALHINDIVHFHNLLLLYKNYRWSIYSHIVLYPHHIIMIADFYLRFSLFLALDCLSFLSLSRLPRFNELRLTFLHAFLFSFWLCFCFISISKRYFRSNRLGSKTCYFSFLLFILDKTVLTD